MYFITRLLKVQGKDNIYVVVYILAKFAHSFAIISTISSSELDTLFFKDVFRLHVFPRIIISDRDNKFTISFWKSPFNQCLEGYLNNYVTGEHRTWSTWLHLGELCYNTTFHISIKITTFMEFYGYEDPSFAYLMFGYCRAQKAKDWLQENQDILRELKDNL